MTELIPAARAGDAARVAELLAAGAALDERSTEGRTAFDLAVDAGHAEVVRMLLEAGADPMADAGPYHELDAMALAAMRGHTAVVAVLLDAGGDPNRKCGRPEYPALLLAATSGPGHPETVDFLLDRGADLEAAFKGHTALAWAAGFAQLDMVEHLLARGAAVSPPLVRFVRQASAAASDGTRHDAVLEALRLAAWRQVGATPPE
ncbi:ankyrin repeat domain-containing protein [Streptomyces sp. NPDC059979]|uniref:ankyrin repeat domain-containing protein n=1 Tax=Streptomyces sp. NPDC059979 TaxID=3347021 RepID=UPI00368AD4E9